MKDNGFEKRYSWSYTNESVHEDIQKNEFVKNLREKLMKKRLPQNSD